MGIAEGTGETYNYNGSTFVNVPLPSGETFDSIGASGEGIWAVNSTTGHVFKYQVSTNSWEPPATGEPTEHFESISAGNFAIGPWAIDNNGGAWLYNSRTGFFDGPIGGLPSGVSAQQVTVGHGQAWVLSSESSDNVYVYDDNPTVEKWFHPNPFAVPTLSEIAESTDESLWGVSAGKVYLFDTSTILFGLTAQPAESIFEVKVGTAGVFVLSSGTGHVYSFE